MRLGWRSLGIITISSRVKAFSGIGVFDDYSFVLLHQLGEELDAGIDIVTLGQIGFSDRSGYTAIGTVCNLAARLCAEANDGQILVSSHIAQAVKAVAKLEDLGNLELKGLRRPVAAFNVVQSTSASDARPNLTVVARGPGA